MSEALNNYRELQRKLTWVRWEHAGCESEQEDRVLEEMDGVWHDLASAERAMISAEPSRMDMIRSTPVVRVRDVVVKIGHTESVRHLDSVAA